MLPNAGVLWHRPSPKGPFRKFVATYSREGDSRGLLKLKSSSLHFPPSGGMTLELDNMIVQIVPAYIVALPSSPSGSSSATKPADGGKGRSTTEGDATDSIKFATEQAFFALAPRVEQKASSADARGRGSLPPSTLLFRARHEKERDAWVRVLLGSARQTEEETWPFGKAHTTTVADDLLSECGDVPSGQGKQRKRGTSTKSRQVPGSSSSAPRKEYPLEIHDMNSEGSSTNDDDVESGGVRSDDSSGGFAPVPTLVVERPSQPQTPDGSDEDGLSMEWDDLCHDSDLLFKAWQGTAKTLRMRRLSGKAPVTHFAASVLKGLTEPEGQCVEPPKEILAPSGVPAVVVGAEIDDSNALVSAGEGELIITRVQSKMEFAVPYDKIGTVLPFSQRIEVPRNAASDTEAPLLDTVDVYALLIAVGAGADELTVPSMRMTLLFPDCLTRDILVGKVRKACCDVWRRRDRQVCPSSLFHLTGAMIAQDRKLLSLYQQRNAEMRLRVLRTSLISSGSSSHGPSMPFS